MRIAKDTEDFNTQYGVARLVESYFASDNRKALLAGIEKTVAANSQQVDEK